MLAQRQAGLYVFANVHAVPTSLYPTNCWVNAGPTLIWSNANMLPTNFDGYFDSLVLVTQMHILIKVLNTDRRWREGTRLLCITFRPKNILMAYIPRKTIPLIHV